jgi:hypothetical protein
MNIGSGEEFGVPPGAKVPGSTVAELIDKFTGAFRLLR